MSEHGVYPPSNGENDDKPLDLEDPIFRQTHENDLTKKMFGFFGETTHPLGHMGNQPYLL